jgi:hypothetical protein
MKSNSSRSDDVTPKGPLVKSRMNLLLKYLDSTQMFFLLLSIPFLIIAPYCLKNIYEIVENTKANNPEYIGPAWSDFLLLFITLPSIALAKYGCYYMFADFYDSRMPEKYQGEIRRIKIEKGCENIFKTVYFTAISLYGYYGILTQFTFDSPVLGNGVWSNYFIDFPYVQFMRGTTYYCMLNLSYHTESAIQMFFQVRNDFYEMLCHHIMTLMLISIAYITNYNNLAIPFMLIIDNADIFIGAIRICVDIAQNKLIVLAVYIPLMVSSSQIIYNYVQFLIH